MLCGAIQELCQCLKPMVKSGDQFNLNMLRVARINPVAPASAERASLLVPRVEEVTDVSGPSNPEEVVQP